MLEMSQRHQGHLGVAARGGGRNEDGAGGQHSWKLAFELCSDLQKGEGAKLRAQEKSQSLYILRGRAPTPPEKVTRLPTHACSETHSPGEAQKAAPVRVMRIPLNFRSSSIYF